MSLILLAGLACAPSDYGFAIPGDVPQLDGAARPEDDLAEAEESLWSSSGFDAVAPSSSHSKGLDTASVSMSWMRGTAGRDKAMATAIHEDRRIVVAGSVGRGLASDLSRGAEVTMLNPSGAPEWTRVIASATEPVTIDSVLPMAGGETWACGRAEAGAVLAPEFGEIPTDWGTAFFAVALSSGGDLMEVRLLGGPDAAFLEAGCGLDREGRLVLDGTVSGGPLQLQLGLGTLSLPSLVDRGFVLMLDPDGMPLRMSTWDSTNAWRLTSVTRFDGSMVQAVAYTGVPDVHSGIERLPPCADGETCVALLDFDSTGTLMWIGSLGPDVDQDLSMAMGPGGELLLAAKLRDEGVLPRRGGPPLRVTAGGTAIAKYRRDMVLDWASVAEGEAQVTGLAVNRRGEAWVALWSAHEDDVRLGGRSVELNHSQGTVSMGVIDTSGATAWLWAAEGPGLARASAIAADLDSIVVAATVTGDVGFDLGGPTETWLVSEDGTSGEPSDDMAVVRLTPRW